MIVACEKCRKKYEIDPEKFEGETSRFRCTSCGNVITVSKSMAKNPNPSPAKAKDEKASGAGLESFGLKKRKLGLRGKIFLIIIVIPVLMLVLAGPIALGYINKAIGLIVSEDVQSATDRAKNEMNQMANSIANQVEVYLLGHPELKREDLADDPGLRKIIFQRVSLSGEASLYLRFNPETREPVGTFLINRNKNVEGQPVNSLMVTARLVKTSMTNSGNSSPQGRMGSIAWHPIFISRRLKPVF